MLTVPSGRKKKPAGKKAKRRPRDEEPEASEPLRIDVGEGSQKVVVKVAGSVADLVPERQFEIVADSLLSFLEADKKTFRKAKVTFNVRAYKVVKKQLVLTVKVSGTVKEKPFDKTFEGKHSINEFGAAAAYGAGGLIGGALYELFSSNKKVASDSRRWVKERLHDFAADTMALMEKKAGRKASSTAGSAKFVPIAAGIAYPIGLIAVFLLLRVIHPGRTAVEQLVIAAIGAVFVSLGAYCVGLLMMPSAYFLRDAAGRKTMRALGAKTPGSMRGICIAGIVVALGIVGAVCYVATMMND